MVQRRVARRERIDRGDRRKNDCMLHIGHWLEFSSLPLQDDGAMRSSQERLPLIVDELSDQDEKVPAYTINGICLTTKIVGALCSEMDFRKRLKPSQRNYILSEVTAFLLTGIEAHL